MSLSLIQGVSINRLYNHLVTSNISMTTNITFVERDSAKLKAFGEILGLENTFVERDLGRVFVRKYSMIGVFKGW